MVVDAFVKSKPGCTKVINLVGIFEVVTNLITFIIVLIGACRVDEPKYIVTTLQTAAKAAVAYRRGE